MKYLGILIALVGAGVFTLPLWLPRVAEVTVTGETFARAGQVGGVVFGAGVVLFVVALFRRG